MAHIPKETIFKIQNESNILEVIDNWVVLKKRGKNYMGLCPFHSEKTPSFSVSPEKQIYYCFGCHEGGNIYRFLMKQKDISFPEAVREVAKRFNLEKYLPKENGSRNQNNLTKKSSITKIPAETLGYNPDTKFAPIILDALSFMQEMFTKELKTNTSQGAKRARDYLEKRKISEEIIEKVGVGYAPANDIFRFGITNYLRFNKYFSGSIGEILLRSGIISEENFRAFTNRLTFPIKTLEGKVIGFNSRVTNGQKKNKYKNPANRELFSSSRIMYGLDLLDLKKVKEEGLFLVEGHTDIFGFLKQGLPSSLAMGSSLLTKNQLGLIRCLNPKKIFFLTDGDNVSKRAVVKNIDLVSSSEIISKDKIFVIPTPEEKDPFDLFYYEEVDIKKYVSQNQQKPSEFIFSNPFEDFSNETHESIEFILENTINTLTEEDLKNNGIKIINSSRKPKSIDVEMPHKLLIGERLYLENFNCWKK